MTAPVDSVMATDVSTTTGAPVTSPAPATTVAPVDTATPAPSESSPAAFALSGTGIGRFQFGDVDATRVVDALAAVLGAPVTDVATEYPTDDGGYFVDESEERGFDFRSGRSVCFAADLCLEFGGEDAAALAFVGYRQGADSVGALATLSGVSSGSRASDFSSAIVVEEGGCFRQGFGFVDGATLLLESSNTPFSLVDAETGEFVVQAPPLDELTVVDIFAGQEPFPLFGDC